MENNNPWFAIWTKPKATITQIVAENPNRSLWLLAFIYGFSSLMNLFQSMAIGNATSTVLALILTLIIAPFYGYISFAIWSWFVYFTGKWFKGQGTYHAVRASYAWSCVPILLTIPLWILMLIIFKEQIFNNFSDPSLLSSGLTFFLFVILIAKVVLAVWAFVIFVNALSAVQQYSVVRSIFNIIVAGIILGIVFAVLWILLLYAFGNVAASPFTFMKPF